MDEPMRNRFTRVTADLLVSDERTVVVLAAIGRSSFDDLSLGASARRRIIDVGIREQTQIGVAGGLALEGFHPILMGYAPFLVERAFEQIKVSLTHQGVRATLVSVGASWDAASEGRTHQAPGDVSLISTLPGWTVHVPGHTDELDVLLRGAQSEAGGTYIRTSVHRNKRPYSTEPGRIVTLRSGGDDAATILALGPAADDVLDATADLDVTVLYTCTAKPLDAHALNASVVSDDLTIVEHHLVGTSTAQVAAALEGRPMRFHAIGINEPDLGRYGSPAQHKAAHGLDSSGIREQILARSGLGVPAGQ